MKKSTITVVLSILCVIIVLGSVFAFVSCDNSKSQNNENNVNPNNTSSDLDSVDGDNPVNDGESENNENNENKDDTSADLELEGGYYAVFKPITSEIDENIGTRMESTVKSLESMLFERGYTEAVVSLEDNNNRIRVEVPDVDDPEEIFNLIGRPASIEFRKEGQNETPSSTPYVTGKDLENAYVSMNNNGQYVISLEFDSAGATKFAAATEERKGSSISIWINGEWVMSPTVNAVISNGKAVIEGNYSYEEAYDLATQIQAGAFDVELELVEFNTITATPDANEESNS